MLARELGERIAAGASAEVFELGPGRVIKLFRPSYAYIAETEAERTRAVHGAGLPAPEAFGLARIEGRVGLVLEDVRGPSLLSEAGAPGAAARLAGLHAELHRATAAGLPSWRAVVERVAGSLGPAERAQYRALVAAMPDGDRVYHGDFHPGNVLRSARGWVVVDWPNACLAHPAADVARSFVLMAHQGARRGTPAAVYTARRAYATEYLRAMLAAGGITAPELGACLPLAAAGVLRGEPGNALADELARIRDGDVASVLP